MVKRQVSFFPAYDGTKDSRQYLPKVEYKKPKLDPSTWQDENYWKLPQNVRNAIDVANMKCRHS